VWQPDSPLARNSDDVSYATDFDSLRDL